MAGESGLNFGNFCQDVVGDGDFVGVDIDDFAVAHEDHGNVARAMFQDGAVEAASQSCLDLRVFADDLVDRLRFTRCLHDLPLL